MPRMLPGITQELMDQVAPKVSWHDFKARFDWDQGQHVALIGPTGSGKTTLANAILDMRKYVVVMATKPRDATLDKYAKDHNFKKVQTWEWRDADLEPKRILWPDAKKLYSLINQRREFQKALASIYTEGSWCVYIDELWYVIHHLKLELEVRTYLQQARSNDISLVIATQRPAFVPLEVYDQSTHLFFWRDNDETNLKRLSGISWLNANVVRALVASLDRYEVLYIRTSDASMARTIVEE